MVCCVVGDGEAETGPLAASWHSNKFLDPVGDGAVLPILHLNGYKIAGPTFLARIPTEELAALMRGYGHRPIFVEGSEHEPMHRAMAAALDDALDDIARIQAAAREGGERERPLWPMIVLRSPKGWTGPAEVDGKPTEASWRSHQVPLACLVARAPSTSPSSRTWLRSYRPEELFDEDGALVPELAEPGAARQPAHERQPPRQRRRADAAPDPARLPGARGGRAVARGRRRRGHPGARPAARRRACGPTRPTATSASSAPTRRPPTGSAMSSTSPTATWEAERLPTDEHLSTDGRVMEVLSEHLCQGWLEGYLLTGRHGLFSCYEAFIHIVDAMFNQHAKWLKVSREIPWRRPIPSLNYLLTSHVWRQDHNGFSHQDPGFIDHVVNKKSEIVRVYLPPDANCLLSVADHCLRTRDYVNVIVAGKQPSPQWLGMQEAVEHCTRGIGIWEWASSDRGTEPRRRDRLRRRRAHPRGPGGGRHPAARAARTAHPRW